ncbi:GMC family oxidoreductase N-terminal domain-containing protein [Saccharopolyspora sp. HNM0983]|uniref:GMC family oxidoreductase N-terminal domain-containing protein n=1 Tax=Saccharopolyspora montiporae TaxID=2781240 RepID=A0A929FVW1_9PSEU|nr:GMC family oxidoreductase N-terminal domain-containing protein [Saccharopolyspora sp. HNM0983]MBE9372876.1 GMC family oxidoreductase N-terminal domain-containing protein [Saccharopolyspora sp. HNM0983]
MATDTATFDYIVVGAGSAGAVAASRLSEDPSASVLLIEAGGTHRHMNVRIPAAFSSQFKTKIDWDLHTEPEPNLDGRRIYHPRGKMLGGSSSMNAMIYVRGNRADYDGWAKAGATGWSYDELLPLFKRSEVNSRGAGKYHGGDGPLHVEDLRSPNPLSRMFVDAMVATGAARNDDFNGAEQEGAGLYQVTHHRGHRWTTADGYLIPASKRRNLTVLKHAHALRLRMSRQCVSGIDVEVNGQRQEYRCRREVVVSAGAFNTPQLLMLSGIGPADHLAAHDIDVVVDNPNVGAHLMDHPMYCVNFATTAKGTLAGAQSPAQLLNFVLRRRGLLTSNVGEGGAFVHTRQGDEAPAMQYLFAPGYFWKHGFTNYNEPSFAIGCSLVGPKSRGTVRLRSSDPKERVAATFNYFDAPEDMDSMVDGIERARVVATTGELGKVVGKELHPGSALQTRTELERAIRHDVEHTYHPACTARIGTERDGVVDHELRVHGVSGLRVADASVFPTIPHGNTHAPSVLAGEKVADLIRGTTGRV